MEPTTSEFLRTGMDLKVRKLLGKSFLRENHLEKAVDVYFGIAQDYPEDADLLIVLANLYLLGGLPAQAAVLYQRVQQVKPASALIREQVAQALAAAAQDGKDQPFPAGMLTRAALDELVARLRSQSAAGKVEEIRAAADLVDKVAAEEREPGSASTANEDVQRLMPALVELTIREARAAGQFELAEALQSLQISLRRQTGSLRRNT